MLAKLSRARIWVRPRSHRRSSLGCVARSRPSCAPLPCRPTTKQLATRSRLNREPAPRLESHHPSCALPGEQDRQRRSPRERFFPDSPEPRFPSPTLSSMNSRVQRLRLCTRIFPEDSPTSTISAIATNKPVPTTPGISRRSRSSRAGFAIALTPQSRIRLPLSVTN